jgi:thymidylate synthase (FAD)
MKLLNPSFEVKETMSYTTMLEIVEQAYRICYASEPKGDAEKFIKSKMKLGHYSPLEHVSISVEFTFDRGVSHEMVRHRLASFSQQSTRYCNYGNEKFGKEISVIQPSFFDPYEELTMVYLPVIHSGSGNPQGYKGWALQNNSSSAVWANKFDIWFITCLYAEWGYMTLLEMGATPQEARSVLPNSLATKILVTMNIREWIHVFNLRAIGTTGKPHPQMVEIMQPAMNYFQNHFPVFFEDLQV